MGLSAWDSGARELKGADGQSRLLWSRLHVTRSRVVKEALFALCRRFQQRTVRPPNLEAAIASVGEWHDRGWMLESVSDLAGSLGEILVIINDWTESLDVNDAKLVLLQRGEKLGVIGTFDQKVVGVPGLHWLGALP